MQTLFFCPHRVVTAPLRTQQHPWSFSRCETTNAQTQCQISLINAEMKMQSLRIGWKLHLRSLSRPATKWLHTQARSAENFNNETVILCSARYVTPLFDFKSIADSQKIMSTEWVMVPEASWRLLLSLHAMNQCCSALKIISKQPALASSNVKAGTLQIVF